jgi:putative inorganic carbon (HCO3(-)) transporter
VTNASALATRYGRSADFAGRAAEVALLPLQVLTAAPSLLFLIALTAMLLRHPDVQFYEIDRVAFALLVLGVVVRAVVLRQKLFVVERITWPMAALTLLAVASVLSQASDHEFYDRETWSLLASKFIVPFALFHLARLVFTGERRFRQFEMFAVLVLAYLSFTAIAFLVGARDLIFPKFILDESLGFHADRARGPLLQAVANGVSLNMLGLLALHAYRRKSIRGAWAVWLLVSVPVAILATMTRAVWLAFAGSVVAVVLVSKNRAFCRICVGSVLAAVVLLGVVASTTELGGALSDRLSERGPVDYREAVYTGGWQMFLERPLSGWGFHQMPAELPHYVTGYQEKVLYPHNTYLELLVELGVPGLALYVWLMWELWRLGRGTIPLDERTGFLDRQFHQMWPILLAVYWANATMVVMSYQFVNGLLFTMAGMLAAQQRRAEEMAS